MSIHALANCIVCRKPILPGQEAKVNKARHESCTGAQPLEPDTPPDIRAMFPNSKLDAFTVQTIQALMVERTYWERQAAGKDIIIATHKFQHEQLERVNGELNRLAKFFLENYSEEIKDPALAQLSSADMAIHLMVKYKQEAEFVKAKKAIYDHEIDVLRKVREQAAELKPETSLFKRIFG